MSKTVKTAKKSSATPEKLQVKRTLHYYWLAIKEAKFRTVILAVLLPVQIFISTIFVPVCVSKIIGRLSLGDTVFQNYVPILTLFAGALLLRTILVRILDWEDWSLDAIGSSYLFRIIFDKLENEPMVFYANRFSGSIASQTAKFGGAFLRLKSTFVWNIAPLALSIILTLFTIVSVSPLYALVLLAFVVGFIGITAFVFNRSREVEIALPRSQNNLIGKLSDTVTNIINVKAFAREDYENERFEDAVQQSYQALIDLRRASFYRNNILNVLNVVIMFILIVMLINGRNNLGLSMENIVLLYTLTIDVCNRIWSTSSIFREINRSFGDAKEMAEILDAPITITDRPDATELVVKNADIDFHDITFRHAEQKTDLFHNFSLTIKPGERIGLVGNSGSGKTTITKLLLRFSELQSGRILIDGQDITAVTQRSLRKNIAYVPQEPILFHRSIAENISYGKPGATKKEIITAARLAGADDFIRQLPKGYSTPAGERGVKLSGGQRQRIAIARAILKDAPILVLDEATSALDSESEALIQKSMDNLMKNRTSIVVAHRLSTIMNLDRIIVLKDGEIIEQGTHRQLLLQNGAYKNLWSRQSGAFLDQDDDAQKAL